MWGLRDVGFRVKELGVYGYWGLGGFGVEAFGFWGYRGLGL